MPKEVVYGHSLPFGDEVSARSIVDVRWNRESGYFQIATRCVDAATGETFVPEQWKDVRGGDEHFAEVPLASDGFYVDLDRRGINDLIRNLRRARDQAFGRDE